MSAKMLGEMANAGPCAFVQESNILDKTKMCKFYAKGKCTRGNTCSFAHSASHLQPRPNLFRTQLCFHFARGGYCTVGDACRFAHQLDDLRPACAGVPSSPEKAKQTWQQRAGKPMSSSGTTQAGPDDWHRSKERWDQANRWQEYFDAHCSDIGSSPCTARTCSIDGNRSPTIGSSTEEGDYGISSSPVGRGTPELQDSEDLAPWCFSAEHADSEERGLAPPPGAADAAALWPRAAEGLTLFIMNTFIAARAGSEEGAPRRAQSAPAAGRASLALRRA